MSQSETPSDWRIATDDGLVDLDGGTGAFKALFEPWETEWHEPRQDQPTEIRRKPGVYTPSRRINGGTPVQNNPDILRRLVELAAIVANDVDSRGGSVYGVGKNHDATIQVFVHQDEIEEVQDFIGPGCSPFMVATPFQGCAIAGIPQKWWDHYNEEPTLKWVPDEFK